MSEKILQLKDWVSGLCWNDLENYVQIVDEKRTVNGPRGAETRIKLRIFTERYRYAIVGIDRDGDEGYLGCVCATNYMLPGESWNRGSDLKDGKFNRETWNGILRDIIRNELKKLSEYVRSGRALEECEKELNEVRSKDDSCFELRWKP